MTKRKHHYLSRFYLSGFTLEPDDTFLHVRSKSQGRSWRARPEEVAHRRDLFRPSTNILDPDEIEDAFADVERQIAPGLHRVRETKELPSDEDLGRLLHVVALNGARPPAEVENLETNLDLNIRRLTADMVTPESHRRAIEALRAAGKDVSLIEDFDEFREILLSGRVKAEVNRDYLLVQGILGRSAVLVDLLAQRRWTLLRSTGRCEFICSDRPVSLLNNRNLPRDTDPRYDDERYDVIMPLSRELCLVGRATGQEGAADASARTIGFINHITETGASEYIYSSRSAYETSPEPPYGRLNGDAYRRDLER